MPTKVAHLSSVHPPFDVRIFHKECRTLADRGYDVTLVVPHDCDEVRGGVTIRAVSRRSGRRARFTRTIRDVYSAAIALNADVYHFHDPELIPVGALLKLRGRRVIYDVHEDLPRQVATKYWIPTRFRRTVSVLAGAAEHVGAWFFDAVVAATPTIAQRFSSKRALVIHNFPLLEEFAAPEVIPYNDRSEDIAYLGGVSLARGAREMLLAMERLNRSSARLRIAGDVTPPALERELRDMAAWSCVDFVGWLDRPNVQRLLGSARIGLVTLQSTAAYRDSYPVKLFEYMAAGLPVVASNFPVWREIVDGQGCGIGVDPARPEEIAEAIGWLLDHPEEAQAMGQRGREAVTRQFNWRAESEKLLTLYDSLL